MPEQNEQPVSNQWWRWPLMPVVTIVGALVTSLVVSFLYHLLYDYVLSSYVGPSETAFSSAVITSCVFGYVYMSIACAMAPSGKHIAGVVMYAVLFAFMVVSAVVIWSSADLQVGDAFWETMKSLVALAAAIPVLVQQYRLRRFQMRVDNEI